MPLVLWEENTFGVTNPEAAALVLDSWNFPQDQTVGLRCQYQPDHAPRSNRFSRMLNIACGIAEKAGYPLPGEAGYWSFEEDCLAEAELTLNHVKSATGYVKDKFGRILKAVA